jgi:hypothetical protein
MNARCRWCLAALALAVTCGGCGGDGLVQVTGRLTWKGQPVPSTEVVFMPDDGSRRSLGKTDDQGNFTLRYSRTQAGATRGPCTVFLRYVPSNEEDNKQIPPKASKELREVIHRYGDPKTSGLHFEITRNGQVVPIELQ